MRRQTTESTRITYRASGLTGELSRRVPMNSLSSERMAQVHFQEARRKALVAALSDLLRGQPAEMLSLADVRARLNVRGQRYLGQHAVPIDHIIGSEGRYGDFDRRFLPRSNKLLERWSSIEKARIR